MTQNYEEVFQHELELLREIAAVSADPNLSALLIAANDSKLRDLLISRLQEGHVYSGALCSEAPADPQQRLICFVFRRASGVFGLVPLSILVVVDTRQRALLRVVDHYVPEHAGSAAPELLQRQPDLDLAPFMVESASGRRRPPGLPIPRPFAAQDYSMSGKERWA